MNLEILERNEGGNGLASGGEPMRDSKSTSGTGEALRLRCSVECEVCGILIPDAESIDVEVDGRHHATCSNRCADALRQKPGWTCLEDCETDETPAAPVAPWFQRLALALRLR